MSHAVRELSRFQPQRLDTMRSILSCESLMSTGKRTTSSCRPDTNFDGLVTAMDALLIINFLNSGYEVTIRLAGRPTWM